MFKKWFVGVMSVLASSWASAELAKVAAGDFQAAIWAASCMTCHGTDGYAEGVGMSITGRSSQQLAAELLAYKSGQRLGTIMHQHARGYSDDELKRIALYFSQFK